MGTDAVLNGVHRTASTNRGVSSISVKLGRYVPEIPSDSCKYLKLSTSFTIQSIHIIVPTDFSDLLEQLLRPAQILNKFLKMMSNISHLSDIVGFYHSDRNFPGKTFKFPESTLSCVIPVKWID